MTTPKKTPYLSNKELLAAIAESREQGEMSYRLARLLQLLCSRIATKGNFVSYSYIEDMQAYAMLMLVKTWDKFNNEKSSNPFSFYTQCINNSFIQFLNQEKRQQNIRDSMLTELGASSSFSFQEEHSAEHHNLAEDEQDFEYHRSLALAIQRYAKEANLSVAVDKTSEVPEEISHDLENDAFDDLIDYVDDETEYADEEID